MNTINELQQIITGEEEYGWVAKGTHSVAAMQDALARRGIDVAWASDTVVVETTALVVCWECGCGLGMPHGADCGSAEDPGAYIWDFDNPTDEAEAVTILMEDGRSFFDHDVTRDSVAYVGDREEEAEDDDYDY